jgi:hypothetical protein
MPTAPDNSPLIAVIDRMRSLGMVPALGKRLQRDVAPVQAELRETIVGQIPAFTESGNPEILPELAAHSAQHVDEIAHLLGGRAPGKFDFVTDNARRRAEQRFPLEATLHAYRCGLRAMSNWIRQSALQEPGFDEHAVTAAAADFAIEYTDIISNLVTAEYVAHTRALSEAEGDRRSELLGTLLGGYDESDGRVARLLRRAGYLEQRQAFCVVLAQSVDAKEMENPARARRLADALSAAVGKLPGRRLLGIRDNHVVALISNTRRVSGWTAPQSKLAERVFPALTTLGPAVLIGMSADVPSTSHIPKALEEARVALDFAHVGQRVVRYSDIPVRQMILRQARSGVQSALPVWVDALLVADRKSGGSLVGTLRAYASANMNVLQAAKKLNVHPNTIYARMQRINDITGYDAREFNALNELLLAADCRQ